MQSVKTSLPDGTNVLLIKDNESPKMTLVLTKTVGEREINHAIDFANNQELRDFASWLENDWDYFEWKS